jgi:type-F conjugative transfer system pilin assembly protein TrbC
MWCCSGRVIGAIGLGACVALWSIAAVADPAIDEILKRSQATIQDAESIAGEEAAVIRERAPATVPDDGAWLAGQPVDLRQDAVPENHTAQQRAWNEVMSEAAGLQAAAAAGPPHPAVPDNVLYVFISLSMPEATLRALLLESLQNPALPPTLFVLRGWQPPDLNGVVERLNRVFPEGDSLGALPNVQINPKLFRDSEVEVVPTFVTKQASGRWGRLMGTTSLADALEKIQGDHYEGSTFGSTYAIEEPDILALIEQRLANIDWQSQVERARAGVFRRTTGTVLPQAREDDSYLVDLTVTVNQDLAGTRGEVFAYQGETVNPFDYMTVQTRYLFFDANSPAQRAIAREWMRQYPYTTLISTVPVEDRLERTAMLKEMGQPVHELNAALISRFSLRAVPAVAYQEGRMLRVDVRGIKPKEPTGE